MRIIAKYITLIQAGLLAICVINLGFAAYFRYVETPRVLAQIEALRHRPPTFQPCSQGQTLLPGESCFIEVPLATLRGSARGTPNSTY